MRFALASLTRGVLLSTLAAPAAGQDGSAAQDSLTAERLSIQVDAREITVVSGQRPVLRYRYSDVPFKPYVRELYSPRGVNVLRDAPADHRHHHGLMFALAVDGVTFWAEEAGAGRQLPHTNTGVDVQDSVAGFSGLLPWLAADRVVLREYRKITVLAAPADKPVTLLTWQSSLTSDASHTLGGEHYYGLGMRFAASMDRSGTFMNAAGAPGEVFRGEERLVRAKWCAYTAQVDGQPVTVAMFDHVGNPRHPATWFTMAEPFAYLSATMSLHTEPLSLKGGQTLDLCYGVAVWDGRVEPTEIEKVYRLFEAKLTPPTPAERSERR